MACNYTLGIKNNEPTGVSAKPVLIVNRLGETGADRTILRRSMGYSFLCRTNDLRPYTPFRLNQDVVPLCGADGSTSGCDPRGQVGNIKYVNDSSDYIRFKKLSAKNRNYNDNSFGGDAHNGAQSKFRMNY